jgi:hypothetical protein
MQAKFACVLGAAFCFAVLSLLTCAGALATYAAAAQQSFADQAKTQEDRLRDKDQT